MMNMGYNYQNMNLGNLEPPKKERLRLKVTNEEK
jgi:hypothetical protein